jgi:arginyl-tRNA synthetase
LEEGELEASSSAMGYGAVKYADLKSHRMTDYKFRYLLHSVKYADLKSRILMHL